MGVFLAIPTEGEVRTELMIPIFQLVTSSGLDVDFRWQIDRPVDRSRTKLAEEFMDSGHEDLLFVDSDTLPPDRFWEMRDIDADIISAPTPILRSGRIAMNAYVWKSDENRYAHYQQLSHQPGPPLEVDAVGFGCVLIRRHVFEKLAKPWFVSEDHLREDGRSEDVNFCYRAKEAGFKIVVDQTKICQHVRVVDMLDWYAEVVGLRSQVKG